MLSRILPFVVFLALTFCQGKLGVQSHFWFYLTKTIVGAWLVWVVWPLVPEMRWRISSAAVLTGVAVFAVWVGLEGHYPKLESLFSKKTSNTFEWNPNTAFGEGTVLAWFFMVVRILGSSIVVPPLEEAFYRSFLYRYIAKQEFQTVPLNKFLPVPFIVTAVIFGANHNEWLPGIFCACAYQALVIWRGNLGDAITAHAITNWLLGIWVVTRGAWQFW